MLVVHAQKEGPHTPRSHSSADPQCKLRWQPQKAPTRPAVGTCALARRRLRNHCKTRLRGARLSLGHFLDQRDICPPVCPMRLGAGQGKRGAPLWPCWTLGPALGHPVRDERFIPHRPGTATVPQAETCHCPGRGRGMLLFLVCCPLQPHILTGVPVGSVTLKVGECHPQCHP